MIIARLLSIVVLGGTLAAGAAAVGQEVIVYSPIEETVVTPAPEVVYGSAPVYVQRPLVVQSAPVTVYRPVVPAPAVTTYSQRVTTYSPVVRTYSPIVTAYSPVVTTPTVVRTAPAYVVRRPVVWQAEYVPGQPVRNVLRAVFP